jgi:hypothetical protein
VIFVRMPALHLLQSSLEFINTQLLQAGPLRSGTGLDAQDSDEHRQCPATVRGRAWPAFPNAAGPAGGSSSLPFMVFVNGGIDFVARLIWEAKTTMRIIWVCCCSPFALQEQIAKLAAGGMLWVARATGMARSRVDVLADDENIADLHSLTVLTLPGFSAAGALVSALAQQRARANRPFHPQQDPELAGVFGHFQFRVEQHVGMSLPRGAGGEAARAVD